MNSTRSDSCQNGEAVLAGLVRYKKNFGYRAGGCVPQGGRASLKTPRSAVGDLTTAKRAAAGSFTFPERGTAEPNDIKDFK